MDPDEPTLPVAPQHASRASNITTLKSLARSSSAKNRAADAPVIPEPTITMSASDGRSTVVRCPSRKSEGSVCQKDAVESGGGRLAILALTILRCVGFVVDGHGLLNGKDNFLLNAYP